jgi:hypothetical protein
MCLYQDHADDPSTYHSAMSWGHTNVNVNLEKWRSIPSEKVCLTGRNKGGKKFDRPSMTRARTPRPAASTFLWPADRMITPRDHDVEIVEICLLPNSIRGARATSNDRLQVASVGIERGRVRGFMHDPGGMLDSQVINKGS